MGFNATRRYRDDKRNDIIMLIAAIGVIATAIAWAAGIL
jgi:hypothetical protein